jgi:ATP-binding cassette subfamily B protein
MDEETGRADQGSPVIGAWRLIRSLSPYFRPYWMEIAAIILGLMLEMAFNTAFPLSLKFLIDGALISRDHRIMIFILALLGGGVVVTSAAGLGRDYLYARVSSSALSNLRFAMFNHLRRLSMDFYARARVGGILSRFSGDLAVVESALAMALPWGALPALEIVSSTALLFLLDYRLALIAMLIWPLSLIGLRYFAPRAVKSSYQKRELESAMLSAVQEAVMAQPVVKAFGLEMPMLANLSERNAGLFNSAVRVSFLSALVERSAGIGILILNVCIIGVGAYRAFNGRLSVGTLVSFETVFLTLSYSISYVSQYVPSLVQATGGLGHIQRLLDQQPNVVDAPGATPLPRPSRELTFRDVTFSYTGEQLNLSDLDLRIAHGEFVAFVGPSGSGKSTLLNLLLRFYDPLRGSISIDGRDLRDLTQESLSSQIAVVFQENFLFNTTIRENIRVGNPRATDQEVEAAAIAAEIHDFIISLPQGYNTPAGERGSRFSGGQRQRIAIARAILRDPAILILDEATSALDPASEAAINTTLARLAQGRTVISITHRLSSVLVADRVFVLDQGRLVESGRPEELLAFDRVYSKMWRKQQEISCIDADHAAAGSVLRLEQEFRFDQWT